MRARDVRGQRDHRLRRGQGLAYRHLGDTGGIVEIEQILRGEFSSKSGMGIGIVGTKNLMDYFDVDTALGKGTVITIRKFLR